MALPNEVAELIRRFEQNRESYLQAGYNEAQVRPEFIDPFFKTLGWDVDNTGGLAEAYKDVIHEDAIRIGSATKAPDYCFRIGGTRKFFLEAKKPSVNIKEDSEPAYQLRRYAWSAKLPLSILTDFEEFAVYDCRVRPKQTDRASTARVMYYRYTDYSQRWDEIASIFSKEAVLKGSFDKYAQTEKRKRGTAEVDAAFLAEIEGWRETLAHNIALRNPQLINRQLNFAVQVTIDRIIFLRICEDRGIEPYDQLGATTNGTDVYQRLMALFRRADDRYNSGLFHFNREKERAEGPDELTPDLKVDDKPLKELIHSLYYPQSPYAFSVLPAEILGQVYEQFLGKVITLTAGYRARVDDKPEVKKAGGVFYTPSYVVNYILKQTVGRLLEGCSVDLLKTRLPKLDRELRVLDPACGSGSFLLGAYQSLLDWYRDYYTQHEPQEWATAKAPPIYRANGGWKLTLAERKRILLDHIFGVDIDAQAVEVTKLSLLLRVLEGEKNLHLFHSERALPDLAENIKCGNSLIGPDFYNGHQLTMFDEEERYRINVFDWHAEFPNVFKAHGFDAVIGNPPYGACLTTEEDDYLSRTYDLFDSVKDVYVAFIEKAHEILCPNGHFGYIVPSAWLGGPAYLPLRDFFLQVSVDSIIEMPFDVFPDAYIDTLLVTTINRRPTPRSRVVTYEYPKRSHIVEIDTAGLPTCSVMQKDWGTVKDHKFVLNSDMLRLIDRVGQAAGSALSDAIEMKRGVLFDESLLTSRKCSSNSYRYFEGDVYRYHTAMSATRWVEYGPKMREYPKDFKWFTGPRILLRRLVNRRQRLMASFLEDTVVTNKNLYTLLAKPPYSWQLVLGIVNSKLLSRLYIAMVSQSTKDDFPQVTIQDFLGLPFPTVDMARRSDAANCSRMARLVETMLQLHKSFAGAKTPNEKTTLQRQITTTDEQIDRLVYALYGLADEEIGIIEGSTQ